MTLQALDGEIETARRRISTDGYPMSIGELTNLYRDNELVIQPAFQRLFRWDEEQKSRLIESILLGLPLPSFFVAQNEAGQWELIDGLQRVSTMLQLQGMLPGHEPLVMQGTKYLPGLQGMSWDDLSDAQRLDIKRSKVDLKIVRRDSEASTKYDLFQRLNSYGSPLTAQEMRHAMLVGINANFASWLADVAEEPDYLDTVALPDKSLAEKYNEELVLRFLYLHDLPDVTAFALRGFGQKLDDASVRLAEEFAVGAPQREVAFRRTFELLNDALGDNAFKKWDAVRGRFSGGFVNTSFEVLAVGLGHHIATGTAHRNDLEEAAKELWANPIIRDRFATGRNTERRMGVTLKLGRELMAA